MNILLRTFCAALLCGSCLLSIKAQENQSYLLHTIEKGQSLYSIASMYGVSQADIVRLNPGSDDKIYVGKALRIPLKAASRDAETYHTIVAGETLYSLSQVYRVSAKELCDANPGLSADNFKVGQVIRIPPSTLKDKTVSRQPDGQKADTQPEVKPRCRDMHKVKRRETIFKISRQYGITEAELIAANPELKGESKIKRGTFLCIPYPTEAHSQEPTVAQHPATEPTNAELFSENEEQAQPQQSLKAAIILPFLSGKSTPQSESGRMIEYYEGFLLAVDSLKRSGVSIELYAYDAGHSTASLQNLLSKREMKRMDIIFGPLAHEQIPPLADFARQHKIRLVIPFTSKDNTVFRNPMVYQINTPQSYLYSEVYDHFVRQFPKANVVFIEATQGHGEKASFIKGLKEELQKHGTYTLKSLKEDAPVESLQATLATDRENIFVPTSGSNLTLIKSLPQLTLLVRNNPEARIHLFGYPEWQTYTQDHLETFFELDTYFYSSFYTNNLLPAAVSFTQDYRKWYSKDMDERYPKYGMLGFDTGYFFLKGLSLYGGGLENNLQRLRPVPIQTGFKFQRVNNWGGFINRKVFFVHFTREYELLKLDFD